MKIIRVVVKFYSERMLMTVDFHSLFKALFEAYGLDMPIEFIAMSESERTASTTFSTIDGSTDLPLVLDRFHVNEIDEASGTSRRPDLERVAIKWGIK